MRRHKFELAEKLYDPCKVIVALGYYVSRLRPRLWTQLPPLRRAKSRRLNSDWRRHFKAARRLLRLVAHPTDKDKYYLKWPNPRDYLELNLGLPKLPKVGKEIKSTEELEEFSRSHPAVLETVKEFLSKGYTEAQALNARRLERERVRQETAWKQPYPKPPKVVKPLTEGEVLNARVKGFLDRIRYS